MDNIKKIKKTLTTEEKIISEAIELFAKKGFEGTSIRDICKKANINVSMISYHFGGKEELYKAIVASITHRIINQMQTYMPYKEAPDNFDDLTQKEKIQLLLMIMGKFIEFFYSGNISNAELMIMFREQMTSSVTINAMGYKFFKRLLASILEKDENDKEVIFRSISIAGQMHSARILKQFSLDFLGQTSYTKEDIEMIKKIVIDQTKAILGGAITNEK